MIQSAISHFHVQLWKSTKGRPVKYAVTPELATLLKTLRMQSGISAKDVARHEGKSPSYISKLEGGSVKSVDKDILTSMLEYSTGGMSFYDDVLPSAYRTLRAFIEPYRLPAQVWLFDYDAADRMVRIPPDMVEDVRRHMGELGVSAAELARFVNANIDSELGEGFPANRFVALDYEGAPRLLFRAEVSVDALERFLACEMAEASYMLVNNLLFSLIRIELFPQVETKLPPDDAVTVLRNTADYMDRWGFHSLVGYSHLMSSPDFVRYQGKLAVEKNNVPERIAAILSQVVDANPLTAINQLNVFCDTLEWDPSFAVKLLGIPFSDLNGMSFSNKARLLRDIQALVDSYDALPDMRKRLEDYS